MPSRSYAGQSVDIDNEGFLIDSRAWTPQVAEAIASEAGIQMTDAHWKVVKFARDDFAQQGQSPGPRRITTSTGVSTKELYQLFPKGPGKLVAKIAGVPKPKSCL
jgi:TusE/DsrC/DsvC family sulfur relay protein